jgi:hypothetical protein
LLVIHSQITTSSAGSRVVARTAINWLQALTLDSSTALRLIETSGLATSATTIGLFRGLLGYAASALEFIHA